MSGKVRFTRRDYEQLPEDWRAELIEGDLLMLPAPDPSHQLLLGRLYRALCDHLGPREADRILLSPTDVHVDDQNILQPDLQVLPEGTKPTPRPWTIPTPVWIAEILSPSTSQRDRGVKLAIYARAGIAEAWLLDPDASVIEVHDLKRRSARTFGSDETAGSRALPGFRAEVGALLSLGGS